MTNRLSATNTPPLTMLIASEPSESMNATVGQHYFFHRLFHRQVHVSHQRSSNRQWPRVPGKFHWHVEDKGICHAYIKASSLQLNGKVVRLHRTGAQAFYQLPTYKDDFDLSIKLAEWQSFHNLSRTHGAVDGRAHYEILRERL